ncbi:MAG TPA: hypothetical protein VFE50_04890 [Cyclobacteriaceae bacterium]|nr:hypothetical protein [Cyclobacteriaceae bacterium]
MSLLPLGVRTFSFTYARKLANGNELTINPRYQYASKNVATEPARDQGMNKRFLWLVPDPQWYYDHYQLRIGIRKPLGGTFGYEPQLQLAYGKFFNKIIKTEDASGEAYDEYLRLDRRYYSVGVINTVNWVLNYDWVRLKFFTGLGLHFKTFNDFQYNRYVWSREIKNFEAHWDSYSRWRLSLHAGIEVGLNY